MSNTQKNNNNNKKDKDYHAYDATSRSVPLVLNDSLLGKLKYNKNIEREDVIVPGARVFLLHNFLSGEECDYLVNATEAIGFDRFSDVANEYPKDYRSNQRLIVLSQPLADTIWGRIQPQLQYKDIENITPLGWASEGLWLPSQINNGFLFSRYKEGNFFNPHYDGMYKNEFDECSIYSVTVYLNDDYEGGKVVFLKDRNGSHTPDNVLYTFTPKKGTALVFNHDTLHAGLEIEHGSKYLFRSGIMFTHVEDLSDPKKGWEKDPLWIRNKAVFKTFTELGKEGDPEKFTKTFLELQQIQLDHGRSIVPVTKVLLGLSEELLFNIFGNLPVKDTVQLAQVCKSWMTMGRNGILWRNLYEANWGGESAKYIQDSISSNLKVNPAIQQWYSICKKRVLMENSSAALVSYISFNVEACLLRGRDTLFLTPFPAKASIDSSPWDNSYDTYSIGSGSYWFHDYDVPDHFTYGELAKAVTFRLNGKAGKNYSSPHPYLFIYERSSLGSYAIKKITEQVRRQLGAEACGFVEASKCSLYAHKQTQGVTILLEAPGAVCISAWHNLKKLKQSKRKVSLVALLKKSKSEETTPISPSELSQSLFDLIIDSHSCVQDIVSSKVAIITQKKCKSRENVLFNDAISLLSKLLEVKGWKLLFCTERDIVIGGSVIPGLPSFHSTIKWKSKLFEEKTASDSYSKYYYNTYLEDEKDKEDEEEEEEEEDDYYGYYSGDDGDVASEESDKETERDKNKIDEEFTSYLSDDDKIRNG